VKVVIEQEKCVAAGQCVLYAPKVFDQREEDGIAVLLDEEPPPEERDNVLAAAGVCPAAAIHIKE